MIVRTDLFDQIAEAAGEANNRATSPEAMRVGMNSLILEVPLETTLGPLQQRLYELQVPAGATLQVRANTSQEGALTELYLRHGQPPTSVRYDATSDGRIAAQSIATVPTTQAGVYYVLLRGHDLPEDQLPVTIVAELLPSGDHRTAYRCWRRRPVCDDHDRRGLNFTTMRSSN